MIMSRCSRAGLLTWLMSGVLALAQGAALADKVQPVAAAASSSGTLSLSSGPAWAELSASQKTVLRPLAGLWSQIDDVGRDKWVNVADRFPRLSPAEKQRVQERMSQWSRLPAQERGEARLRFQQTRQLTPDERQQKWAAYQALSPEDRKDLTRQAQRKAKPVLLADSATGPREAKQAFTAKRPNAPGTSAKKSNVVPNTLAGVSPATTSVTPTMVKAGTGATTSLVTQRPSSPLHQHAGLPKITATKGFVDPVTLLPKKGAQGAAMASLPDSAWTDGSRR